MKPEQQRIAIAEACGWTCIEPYNWSAYEPYAQDPTDCGYVPDYLNDLNAMLEVEKVLHLLHRAQLCVVYRDYLNEFMARDQSHGNAHGLVYYATAAQRAEAFLKAINLWKE